MANAFSYQVIKDTEQLVVIKLTGKFDGSGQELNQARIAANSLYGALATNGYPVANVHGGSANTPLNYYGLNLNRLWYDCSNNGDVELYWQANTNIPLMFLNGNGEFDGSSTWTTIPNNAKDTAGCNGDIVLNTRGMAANDSYTIIAEFRKENEYYQRGQFNDPAAFNYGSYSIRPAP
jgi:hypothetical protein